MGALSEVKVPDIGDFEDVEIIEVLVSPGDSVQSEDPLITLESDKATMDVPAPEAGVVRDIKVHVGDRVSQGTLILTLEGQVAANEPAPAGATQDPQPPAPAAAEQTGAPAGDPVAATDQAAGDEVEVRVPDIGDFTDVPVIEVLVKVGDRVAAEDPLITLESDKATMDVPAPVAGTVEALHVGVGDTLSEGAHILTLKAAQTAAAADAPEDPQPLDPQAPATAPPRSAEPAHQPPPTLPPPVERAGGALPHASPSVRYFARELGVELSRVRGSGPKGRILKADVQGFVKAELSQADRSLTGVAVGPATEVDFSKFGPVDIQELPRIKKLSGAHLHRAWITVPHVTHHDEADVTEMEAFRKTLKADAERQGVRVTGLLFLMKALVAALREFPGFNSSLTSDGQRLVYKKYFHIGIAVDTPRGLVVPVFRDVDKKGIWELAAEMGEVSQRARDGKLKPGEMQGGCMSISNLGGLGGTAFTPIVNAPEVAILGATRSRIQPVWRGDKFEPRLMMPLDLSYDHRVIDGAEAARFVAFLCEVLGDVRRMLL